MPAVPLMPKATAVWLVEHTTLSFEQIGDFCGLHKLEVQAIADGEVAAGIIGMDPVLNGQLTSEEIKRAKEIMKNTGAEDISSTGESSSDVSKADRKAAGTY